MVNAQIAYVAAYFNAFTNEWDWVQDPFVTREQALAVCQSYNDPACWLEEDEEPDESTLAYVPVMLITVEDVDGIWTPREYTPIEADS